MCGAKISRRLRREIKKEVGGQESEKKRKKELISQERREKNKKRVSLAYRRVEGKGANLLQRATIVPI